MGFGIGKNERLSSVATVEVVHEELARKVSRSCVNIEAVRMQSFTVQSAQSFFDSLFPELFPAPQHGVVVFPTNGAGFAVDRRHVMTNNHVVEHSERVITRFVSGVEGEKIQTEAMRATVVARDVKNDLAVIRTEKDFSNPPLDFAGSETLSQGQSVIAMKNLLVNRRIGSEAVIEGKTSHLQLIPRALVLRSKGIQKGDSGSPVINEEGKVVGVLHAIGNPDPTVVFAVPVEEAIGLVKYAQRIK